MSQPEAKVGDNAGRCESCNLPETVGQTQQAYPVKLGGYGGEPVLGSMWLCPACLSSHQARDEARPWR